MSGGKKWTAKEVEQLMILAQGCLSLNTPVATTDAESDGEIGDTVIDTAPNPEELAIQADNARIVREYIAKYLDPREMKVILMRFGFETGKPMTLEEVGERFNVTRERVRQVEMKALNKLRYRFARNKIPKEDLQ